ncbi:MAG: PAS domain S-box protein, partial [Myxococcales bacterium]|nr:PAS domain S-box protein [Myxococcales bacterium]
HVERVSVPFARSVENGEDWSAEFPTRAPDSGEARWVRAFVRSHFDAEGSFRSATGAWIDVTDERRARSESARFAELLAHVPDFVAIAATDGRVVYRNPAAAAILPEVAEHALELLEVFDEGSRALLVDEVVPTVESHGAWSGELRINTTSGELKPVLASFTRHADEITGVEYVTVIARDITEMKVVEDLLRDQAMRDPLTKLPNRAAFDAAAEAEPPP